MFFLVSKHPEWIEAPALVNISNVINLRARVGRYLELKNPIDIWVIYEVYEILLVFLIHVLAGHNFVEVCTRHVARQATRNLFPCVYVRPEETVWCIYPKVQVKLARDTEWYREELRVHTEPKVVPSR